MGTLLDISRPLSPATAVWPGDRAVEWHWTARKGEEMAVNVGAIATSTHAGTHADAPLHVRDDGEAIDGVPLAPFVGPADVIAVDAPVIRPGHLPDACAPRLLFQTRHSAVPHDTWDPDLAPIHPDTIEALSERDVVLVGTDAPSVDPVDSTILPAHHALIRAGIVNLENLALKHVPPGRYELMALPLRITGADAAPVRAVLRVS